MSVQAPYAKWQIGDSPVRTEKAHPLLDDSYQLHQLLIIYRYISWLLTSLFYLGGEPQSVLIFKLGVTVALFVAGQLTVRLYAAAGQHSLLTAGVVGVETIGLAYLLVPTGGLNSPFLWYALNPLFVAATMLPVGASWLTLFGFLMSASLGTHVMAPQASIAFLWRQKSWTILVLLLLTAAAQMFAKLLHQLSYAYQQLRLAHQMTEQQLEHTTSLYQAVEAFSANDDTRQLVSLLASYVHKLTGSRAGICFLVADSGQAEPEIFDPEGILTADHWLQLINSVDSAAQDPNIVTCRAVGQGDLVLIYTVIQSDSTRFGVLGYLESISRIDRRKDRALGFLANLGAIVMERRNTDNLTALLMIAEEQNRIANEIHDGVSQHLFGIVYALHGLARKRGSLQERDVQDQLSVIQRTAQNAARELRSSIYRISPSKRGEQVFVTGLSSYLTDMAHLNNVHVDFVSEGQEDALSPALRKSLYRIVKEATANSVRHGEAKNITVSLSMHPERTSLEVQDDGKGFDTQVCHLGLGLQNMRNLMAAFGGSVSITSEPGNGCLVRCVIPSDERLETRDDGESIPSR